MHCQNVCVIFNFAETVHSRNKSHTKFKAFTVNARVRTKNTHCVFTQRDLLARSCDIYLQ